MTFPPDICMERRWWRPRRQTIHQALNPFGDGAATGDELEAHLLEEGQIATKLLQSDRPINDGVGVDRRVMLWV